MELQASPATTSKSSQLNADEIPFEPGGFTAPELFQGVVRWVTCEMNLILLSRFLADYDVRRSTAGERQGPHR